MRLGLIYKATCLITNKSYIGQTINLLEKRKRKHCRDSINRNGKSYDNKFYRALRKYGIDNFKWEILYNNIVEDQLNIAEICVIYINNSFYDGYNSTEGGSCSPTRNPEVAKRIGNSNKGKIRSTEDKIKMSESRLKFYQTKEGQEYKKRQQQQSPWNKGLKMGPNPEHSIKMKGRKISEGHKQKISKRLIGVKKPPRSEEYKKNSSVRMKEKYATGELFPSFKGKNHTEEAKQKNREAHTGNKASIETKEKMSIKHKKQWEDLIFAKKMIESFKILPNKAELYLQDILNSLFFEGQFQYVGDGKEVVGRKCPDFIDKTNNKIIELYGDYWHRGQDPNDRIDYFKQFGYGTLVIWESELKNIEYLKNKLFNFGVTNAS